MATREQLIEANKKAVLSPNTGKRGLNKTTLLKRAAEERYVEKLVREFDPIIDVQLKEAKKPENVTERIHVTKVVLSVGDEERGDKHLHLHQHSELNDAERKLLEEYEAKLKELKTK